MIEVGYSKDAPSAFGSRNGQVIFRFNVEPVEVEPESGAVETQYKFEQRAFPPPADKSVDGVKALLKSVAAHKRWLKEVGGATWNGHQVHTDDRSQTKIVAAYIAAMQGVRPDPSRWKTPAGFIDLTNADAIEMALAVQAHIQSCYDAEKAIGDQIDACTSIAQLIELPVQV
jgi:hypothetical protein